MGRNRRVDRAQGPRVEACSVEVASQAMCVCARVCMSVHVCLYVCACVPAMCARMCTRPCVSARVCMCARPCVSARLCMCACHVCLCTYVHVCLPVSVYRHLGMRGGWHVGMCVLCASCLPRAYSLDDMGHLHARLSSQRRSLLDAVGQAIGGGHTWLLAWRTLWWTPCGMWPKSPDAHYRAWLAAPAGPGPGCSGAGLPTRGRCVKAEPCSCADAGRSAAPRMSTGSSGASEHWPESHVCVTASGPL